MRVDVTRQPGKPGFFRVERSKDFEERMFVSAPYTSEITRDEAMSLIEALIMKAEEIWPCEAGCTQTPKDITPKSNHSKTRR